MFTVVQYTQCRCIVEIDPQKDDTYLYYEPRPAMGAREGICDRHKMEAYCDGKPCLWYCIITYGKIET